MTVQEVPELKGTTAGRLVLAARSDDPASLGIELGTELMARITVTRLPHDEWPDFHPAGYTPGTVMRPADVYLTFRWSDRLHAWEYSTGGISGRKIKKDGTPGLVELRDGFYGSMPYGQSEWARPVVEAVLEYLNRTYELAQPVQVATPAWLAYAGVPLEDVPGEYREAVAAHRAGPVERDLEQYGSL